MIGTVMVLVAPDGRVVADAASFAQRGAAGFDLKGWQEIDCRRALEVAVFEAYASPPLIEATDHYTRERIVQQMLGQGYKRHTIIVEVPQASKEGG